MATKAFWIFANVAKFRLIWSHCPETKVEMYSLRDGPNKYNSFNYYKAQHGFSIKSYIY